MAVVINGNNGISYDDSGIQYYGTGDDLAIYHDGSNAYITNSTGTINLSNNLSIEGGSLAQITITDNSPSNVSLYLGAGNSSVSVGSTTSDSLIFLTANTERMRIDTSGNVGIGTDSPTDRLHVNSGTSNRCATFESTDTGAGIHFKDVITTGFNGFQFDGPVLRVFGADTERMRIDSNGNVGIGTTPSSSWRTAYNMQALQIGQTGALANLDVSTTDRRVQLTQNSYLNSSGDFIRILEGHATLYQQTVGTHRFYTTSNSTAGSTITYSEVSRIDSSGNTLLGGSDGLPTIQGTGGGKLALKGRSNSSSVGILQLEKIGDTGSMIDFRYGSTIYGAINLLSNGISVDTGTAGSIYLGGSASANRLDDYEEGTFSVTSTRNGVGEDVGGWIGRYVKVGSLVHVTITTDVYVRHAGSGYGTGQAFIITSNLPFTPVGQGGSQVAHTRTLANPEKIALCWRNNSTTIYLNQTGANNGYNPENNVVTSSTQTNITLAWSGSYFTNS